MAVMETAESKTIALRLITGTSASGANQYKSMNIGPINPDAEPTNSRIWALAQGIAPLIQYQFEEVTKTWKSSLKNEE